MSLRSSIRSLIKTMREKKHAGAVRSPRLTIEEIDAMLTTITAAAEADSARIRAEMGDEAFASWQAKNVADAAAHDEYLRSIEIKPEWLACGADLRRLTEDQYDAVVLRMFETDSRKEESC